MRVLSAGKGATYLLQSVAVGDGVRDASVALTRYYAEKGTPPGFWIGSALPALGAGEIATGDTVTETQLRRLLAAAHDPITDAPLGRALPEYRTLGERISARVSLLPDELTGGARAEAITRIEEEEQRKPRQNAVTGFDHTFSVPKSVSALWAVADGGTQAIIAEAHHAALADVLDLLERHVAMTRTGADAGNGSVVQSEVRGVIAAAYDHYDSRASDPQLHTHVVIANRVQGAADGRWRTLDSRMLHHAVVALSEHYNGVLADYLTRRLGLDWERRERAADRNDSFELAAVPDELIREFSSRSADIEAEKDRLVAEFEARHGHEPSTRAVLQMRAEATIATRPDKVVHSLAELTEQWRSRATRVLGADAPTWAQAVLAETSRPVLLRADDLPVDTLARLGETVVDMVGQKRSTWRRWNLHAEASRQITELRFATTADREFVIDVIVDAAERASIRLTPPEIAHTPIVFQRPDGTSQFRIKHGALYSSNELLAAEDRLLALANDRTGPGIPLDLAERVGALPAPDGSVLSVDQVAAMIAIGVSSRKVDVLVGPAGAGKTSTLAALRRAWEQEHGSDSVIGLAPTARAAEVLADDLGTATENTAKWLAEHHAGRWAFRAGQLVIVDEASTAGTFALDQIAQHAAAVGAKLLLVGDPAQLDAVDSSGAFSLLVDAIEDRPELTEVWRLKHPWEKVASLRLRLGSADAVDEYAEHERIDGGDYESMLAAVYRAWLTDIDRGMQSMMIAETAEAVAHLNARARVDRIRGGIVDPEHGIALHDGTEASPGDLVVTRLNDRRLRTDRRWVKNGDTWVVTDSHSDGSLTIRPASGGAAIRLPANYAAAHVELAYAVTAYRAQGSTVDSSHALIHSSSMSRESLYVAMTRGRWSNHAYVATDQILLEEHQQRPDDEITAKTVLVGILGHRAAELSAHETIRIEQETWTNIAQLAAEYDTIAQAAQRDRWVVLLRKAGLDSATIEATAEADSFGALAAELRRAEANHFDPERLLRDCVAERGFTEHDDIPAVLRSRIQRAVRPRTGSTRGRRPARLIAGILPAAVGIHDPDMKRALDERAELIEQRARTLVETAIHRRARWLRELGPMPQGRAGDLWRAHAATVAAYRDRWRVESSSAFGAEPQSTNQRIDLARAQAALRRARELGAPDDPTRAAGRGSARTL